METQSLKGHQCRLAPTALALVFLGGAFTSMADERILYKSILPNGQVVYGDEPEPQAKRSIAISVERHPPSPQEAEAAQRALAMTRAQLLRDAAARAVRLKQLDNQIGDVYDEFQNLRSKQRAGREVGEGDRQGRRFSHQYAQRQHALLLAAAQAQQRLDNLVTERTALGY